MRPLISECCLRVYIYRASKLLTIGGPEPGGSLHRTAMGWLLTYLLSYHGVQQVQHRLMTYLKMCAACCAVSSCETAYIQYMCEKSQCILFITLSSSQLGRIPEKDMKGSATSLLFF
jgi:hypothetical protein